MATTLRVSMSVLASILVSALCVTGCAKGSRIPSSALDDSLLGAQDASTQLAEPDAGGNTNTGGSGSGATDAAVAKPVVMHDAGNGDVLTFSDASAADSAAANSCSNGVKDGIEDGVDCGGLCDPCVSDAGTCTPATCGAMECGQKPNGCGATLTCTYQCPSGNTCTANKCVATPPPPPTCTASTCAACPALQSACCTSAQKCGCALLGFLGCS